MPARPSWSATLKWLFSSVALGISIVTLYLVHCELAQVVVFPAERIGFDYPYPNQELRVTVPVLFSNHGAQPAIVQTMGLVITDPSGADPRPLFLKWDAFCSYNEDFVFTQADRAVALNLPGNSSQSKYVAFKGAPEFAGWIPAARTYNLQVLAWTRPGLKPDIQNDFPITFSENDHAVLGVFVRDKRGLFWWVDRDQWGRWQPKVLSPAEHDQLLED